MPISTDTVCVAMNIVLAPDKTNICADCRCSHLRCFDSPSQCRCAMDKHEYRNRGMTWIEAAILLALYVKEQIGER